VSADNFSEAMVPIPGPTAKTSIKYKCIELGSALSAIFRAHALKNLYSWLGLGI